MKRRDVVPGLRMENNGLTSQWSKRMLTRRIRPGNLGDLGDVADRDSSRFRRDRRLRPAKRFFFGQRATSSDPVRL